jgi:repressor of nif and glnA expression
MNRFQKRNVQSTGKNNMPKAKAKAKTTAKAKVTKKKVVDTSFDWTKVGENVQKNAEQISKNIMKNAETIGNNVAKNSKAVGDRMTAYLNRNNK